MKYILFMLGAAGALAHGAPITCEHYLNNSPGLQREVERQVFDRMFIMTDREEGVRDEAYAKLQLPARMNEKAWHNVVLSLHRPRQKQAELLILQIGKFAQGELHTVLQNGTMDDTPVLWRVLEGADRRLGYKRLLETYPLEESLKRGAFETEFIGYATDPDVDGVRLYVAARSNGEEEVVSLDLGLDVPCESYGKYALQVEEPRLVRTPGATFCRISMMSFSADRL